MDPIDVVIELGGFATWKQLREHCSRTDIETALGTGVLVRLSRDAYAHRAHDAAEGAARRLRGKIVGLSAALQHRWEIARQPEEPWISIPRNRHLRDGQRDGVRLFFLDVAGDVQEPLDTVLFCSRQLPFGEALAVADSALRRGTVDAAELRAAADMMKATGSARCRRVAREATPLAANPFESMLRALVLDVPGLDVEPQVEIELPGFTVHPDLVDAGRRIVIEADSWMHHASTGEKFERDVERYALLVGAGWTVLRFTPAQVLTRPEFVSDVLNQVAAR